MSSRVIVNVSGVRFEFDRKLLKDKKYHRLTNMCEQAERKQLPLQFTVDRPSESFAAILTYYQTGELHMPAGVCPGYFKKELAYWEIEHDELADCCLFRYHAFFDEQESRQKFLKDAREPAVIIPTFVAVTSGTSVQKVRKRLWAVIDYQENTLIAKVYFVVVMFMVLLSIMNIALGTLPGLRRSLTQCEYLDYLTHKQFDKLELVRERFGYPDCDTHSLDEGEFIGEDIDDWDYTDYHDWYYEEYEANGTSPKTKQYKHKKLALPFLTMRHVAFIIIDYIVAAFFTVDLLCRLLSCPSLARYFISAVNVIDICAVIGSYCHMIITHVQKEHMYEDSWIRVVDFFQVFRALRLFRIVRNVTASKVLAYSLRQNIKDVSLLVVLMLVGVSSFAMLYYLLEDRSDIDSIPLAWYWTIVTMTTVGYGDISPKTVGGRILAAVCACCGVLLLAVTLPVFVNNFLTLYQYSCINETLQKQKEHTRKLKGAIRAVAIEQKLNHHKVNTEATDVISISEKVTGEGPIIEK